MKFEKMSQLRPAFDKNGTITAANATKINDGAAALVVMSAEKAKQLGLKPLARIVDYATASKEPQWFTTAPADSIERLLKKVELTLDEVDLFEINGAFAVVTLAVNKILGLDVNKLNVARGAVALGHPIVASGARILTTLIYDMKRLNKPRGVASICIGDGEAISILVER